MRTITIRRNISKPARYAYINEQPASHPYNITDASLRRVEQLAVTKTTSRYSNLLGQPCIAHVYTF